jgi:hypothetical protein
MKIPLWKNFCAFLGAILGDKKVCESAMENGCPLLVFPGGAREVMRDGGIPKYTLQWGDRSGFAKMAIKHGYTIIPVSGNYNN